MKNEKTGKEAAAIAGRILRVLSTSKRISAFKTQKISVFVDFAPEIRLCSIDELKVLAASALTQAQDKKRS